MKLYNTLSRKIEEFIPQDPNLVKLYACGPTVYDFTHIGHVRKYTMDDVLVRTLRHAGYDVKFVRNITDVGHLASDSDTGEDKLEKGAKKYGSSVWDIAQKFEDYFHQSMDTIGNVRPNITSKVTEHIQNQLDLVKKLEEKGFTYVIPEDGVYFDTSKFPRYGELAKLNKEGMKDGARVDVVAGKRNPLDFALWKFERAGENRAMAWESPWHPRSFPGWHIECSAISMEHLGEQIDLHTGGIDHIPVHHTNEIAQSEAATGKSPFVKYWVHHNFLFIEGKKMSKSLNNFFTLEDLAKKEYDPMAFRLLLLTAHYRSEMNFTWDNMEGSQVAWEKLMDKVQFLLKEKEAISNLEIEKSIRQTVEESEGIESEKVVSLKKRFFDAMENDLSTPEAIAVMWEMLGSDLRADQKYSLLLNFDEVLGLGLARIELKQQEIIPESVEDLVDQRQVARDNKDWQLADDLRSRINDLGYEIIDHAVIGQELIKK